MPSRSRANRHLVDGSKPTDTASQLNRNETWWHHSLPHSQQAPFAKILPAAVPVSIVEGYVCQAEKSLLLHSSRRHVPIDIIGLIKSFYPRSYTIRGIGWNHYGEFSLGHNQHTEQFTQLPLFEAACDDPRDIHAGWKRFTVRNAFDSVFCCGRNVDDDLGLALSPRPDEVSLLQHMPPILEPDTAGHHAVFSGSFAFHTFFLSASHRLYAAGANQSAQCGHRRVAAAERDTANEPSTSVHGPHLVGDARLFGGAHLSKIVCGDNFSLFLTRAGALFSCGNNRYGSCGHAITERSATQMIEAPRQLALTEGDEGVRVADVNCGGRHVLATGADGRLWCFGQNIFKQLGLAHAEAEAANTGVPQVNGYVRDHCSAVCKVVCGFSHSMVLGEEGEALLFGRNHKGQCAKYDAEGSYAAQTVETPFRFQDYAARTGDDVGAAEETSDDDSWVVGSVEDERCFAHVRVVDGSGGYEHTVMVTRDNELISFGGNGSRQCQPGMSEAIVAPAWLSRQDMGVASDDVIERVICGIDTTLVVCSAP